MKGITCGVSGPALWMEGTQEPLWTQKRPPSLSLYGDGCTAAFVLSAHGPHTSAREDLWQG